MSVIYSNILLFIIQHPLSLSILKSGFCWSLVFLFHWSCTNPFISQLSLCTSFELVSQLQHHPSIFPCSVYFFSRGCKFHLTLMLFIHHGCLGEKKKDYEEMLTSLLAFFLQTFLKQICRTENEEGSGTAVSQGLMKTTRKNYWWSKIEQIKNSVSCKKERRLKVHMLTVFKIHKLHKFYGKKGKILSLHGYSKK